MTDSPSDLLSKNIVAAKAQFDALESLKPQVQQAADLLKDCLLAGHKVLTCGNGGSAADAAHITTEFVCRFCDDRKPYPSICFTDSGSTLSAISNDYDFDQTFARQVHAFGQTGDVLIAISTSGNSQNVRQALLAAKQVGIASIALLGRDGGQCTGIATVDLIVPGDVTARIQEAHTLVYHTICEMIEPALEK